MAHLLIINVLPSNIRSLPIRIKEIKNKNKESYTHAHVTIPSDLIKRNSIQDGDTIVIIYYCKEGEDPNKDSEEK